MHEPDAECRVIDLAEYRARRIAAGRSRPRTPRYFLWYPGLGCVDPAPKNSPSSAPDWWSGRYPG